MRCRPEHLSLLIFDFETFWNIGDYLTQKDRANLQGASRRCFIWLNEAEAPEIEETEPHPYVEHSALYRQTVARGSLNGVRFPEEHASNVRRWRKKEVNAVSEVPKKRRRRPGGGAKRRFSVSEEEMIAQEVRELRCVSERCQCDCYGI